MASGAAALLENANQSKCSASMTIDRRRRSQEDNAASGDGNDGDDDCQCCCKNSQFMFAGPSFFRKEYKSITDFGNN